MAGSNGASGLVRSNILGLVAILLALSGTAIALPGKNKVDSGDIENRQVRGKDLARDAVSSSKVADDSLTGADIDESKLSIPATGGGGEIDTTNLDAATVDGASIVSLTDNVGNSVGGVDVSLSCFNGTSTVVFVETSVDDSKVYFEISGAEPVFDPDYDSADDVLTAASTAVSGDVRVLFQNGSTGRVVSMDLGWRTDYGTCSDVDVIGQAIG